MNFSGILIEGIDGLLRFYRFICY